MAAKSLEVFEQALNDTHDPRERLNDLPDAAQAAFEAGEYERAAAYSKELLSLAEQPEYADNNSDAIITVISSSARLLYEKEMSPPHRRTF